MACWAKKARSKESANGRRWIIDPIDGTRDFIRGTRAWSVLIGPRRAWQGCGGPRLLSVDARDVFGGEGRRRVLGWARRFRLRRCTKKSEALLCCNGLSYMHRYPFANDLVDWLAEFWTVRSMGGCLDAMLVAIGRADVWIEAQAEAVGSGAAEDHRGGSGSA